MSIHGRMEMNNRETLEIERALMWLGVGGAREKAEKMYGFLSLVVKHRNWGRLLGRGEHGPLMGKHVADSLCILETMDTKQGQRVADIGSGGGFPGLILAIARPAAFFELIEANRRKCSFLALAIGRLEIENARVIPSRAEEVPGESYDIVLSRAAGKVKQILPVIMTMLRPGGFYLGVKGTKEVEEEERAARTVAGECGGQYVGVFNPRLTEARGRVAVLIVRKRGADDT